MRAYARSSLLALWPVEILPPVGVMMAFTRRYCWWLVVASAAVLTKRPISIEYRRADDVAPSQAVILLSGLDPLEP